MDLNAEEHDRSYLYGDDEKPARSAQKSGGMFARLRGWLGIAPAASTDSSLDEYAGDEAFVSAVVDETHPETTQMPVQPEDSAQDSARGSAQQTRPAAKPNRLSRLPGRLNQAPVRRARPPRVRLRRTVLIRVALTSSTLRRRMRPQPAWIRCSAPPWRTTA